MLKFNRNLYKSIKIKTNPDIEEFIYHTLQTQKFYLQIGFPAESPFYGNIVIYQLNLRLQHNEIWISNIGAQTHQPQQELIPVLILTPAYMQVPSHGPGSGALIIKNQQKLRHQIIIVTVTILKNNHIITK